MDRGEDWKDDETAFLDAAKSLELTFTNDERPKRWPRIALFQPDPVASHCFVGSRDEQPDWLFYLATGTKDEDGPTDLWTVVLFARTSLPPFDCVSQMLSARHRWWRPRLSFDPDGESQATREAMADFQRRYQVSPIRPEAGWPPGATEEQLRELFRVPQLRALADRPGWMVQTGDDCLVLARPGHIPPRELPRILAEAHDLRNALVTPPQRQEPVLRGLAGKELGRQQARMIGRGAGAAIGIPLGFFGGFIVGVSIFMANDSPHHDHIKLMPILGFGGLAICTFVCSVLGGWIKSWLYRPEQPWRPTARHEASGCALTAGAGIGWVVGGVVGMALIIATASSLPEWATPWVFFGPPLLGLILGGVLANYIAARRHEP